MAKKQTSKTNIKKGINTKMIPFDIEEAKKGAKVVNREGYPVRIVCFDSKQCGSKYGYPIVALHQKCNSSEEELFTHTFVGKENPYVSSGKDLMLLVELKEYFVVIYESLSSGDPQLYPRLFSSHQEALLNSPDYAQNILSIVKVYEEPK